MIALLGAAMMAGGDLFVPGLGPLHAKMISGAIIIAAGFAIGRES